MAYSKTGDGYVGANKIYAGRLYDGTVTITSGTYSVTAPHSGSPDYGYAPTTATVTLTGSTTDVTVEGGGGGYDTLMNVGL